MPKKQYDWDNLPNGLKFGAVSDRAIAEQLQVHPSTIGYQRQKRGIPICVPDGINWDIQPLGQMSDSDLAHTLGVTPSAVLKHRHRRKIPTYKPPITPDGAINLVYKYYKYNAEKRSLVFELSKKDFVDIASQNCAYCDDKPSQSTRQKHGTSVWQHNGIDRLDSHKGYITSNCVSCCTMCNMAKSNNTLEVFFNKVDKMSQYLTAERRAHLLKLASV